MPRKKKPAVEIIRANPASLVSQPNRASLEAVLDRLVQERVAEALSRNEGFALEPHFSTKRVSDEIRRYQTVPERRKWTAYFERWGCIVCRRRKVIHEGRGYCGRCRIRIYQRLLAIERELSKEYAEQNGSGQVEKIVGRVKAAERLLGRG